MAPTSVISLSVQVGFLKDASPTRLLANGQPSLPLLSINFIFQVGDNQRLLQSLKDSPYYKAFEDKASIWEKRLADLDEYLMNLNQVIIAPTRIELLCRLWVM